MNAPNEALFQTLFNHLTEPRIVVKTDAPRFTIVACNEQYKIISNTIGKDLVGKGINEIYQSDNSSTNNDNIISDALIKAATNNEVVKLAAVRYDIPAAQGNNMEENWWQTEYVPIPGTDSKAEYLLCTIHNITKEVLSEQSADKIRQQESAIQEGKAVTDVLRVANKELEYTKEKLSRVVNGLEEQVAFRTKEQAASESYFKSMILQVPVAIGLLAGKELIVETINDKLLELWDKNREDVIGKPISIALPEMEGQPYLQILEDVFESGETYNASDAKVFLMRNNVFTEGYYNFINHPLKDSNGKTISIMIVAIEVTAQVQARLQQQEVNEELAAINEELTSTNEELAAINEALAKAKDDLQQLYIRLAESEARLRYMLADAPVSISLLAGRELIIESANKKSLEAAGKTEDVIGKPLHEAMPELAGQQFLDILDNVFMNGEPFYGSEVRALVEKNGVMEEMYSNFVYHPLKNAEGKTTHIMAVANVVTEQVLARKQAEQAEEMLRFSIEAANVGTWFINGDTQEFITSGRLKDLFGFYPDEPMSVQAALNQIPEDYRCIVEAAMKKSITEGYIYNVEHPVIGYHDHKQRWVRALGRVIEGTNGNFSGVLIDITEQKMDEIRKNDFIAMVSHELKTPLTSLKAYTQLVIASGNIKNAFDLQSLNKINSQVDKMTGMINSFLNVARLETGKIHLEKKECQLHKLIEEAINEVSIVMQTNTIRFVPCEPLTLQADCEKIEQVINNLLSNAVKYSPKGKPIEIKCWQQDSIAWVSVKDEGVGIQPQDTGRLFERFYRADNNLKNAVTGFGIGLYICAEIIKRHNGSISVVSEPGKGSNFFFCVPMV